MTDKNSDTAPEANADVKTSELKKSLEEAQFDQTEKTAAAALGADGEEDSLD